MPTNWTEIARFTYTSEALIIKGKLEASGITTTLWDSTIIDTDPLVSQAIGGVKLMVPRDSVIKAKHILNEIEAYAVDDEGEPLICPNCGSDKVELMTTITDFKSFASFLAGLVFGVLPFYTRYQYRCERCKHKFNQDS